ncbi:MAG: 30S ribosome-binding factor RbfA [Elusimicrobiota bacterium]
MHPYKRSERISELIRSKICQILIEIGTPQEAGLITITDVTVTDDLSQATAYYSILGGEQQKESAKQFFQENHRTIWHFVGDGLVIKKVPTLRFVYDETPERAERIFSILDRVSTEQKVVSDKATVRKRGMRKKGAKKRR